MKRKKAARLDNRFVGGCGRSNFWLVYADHAAATFFPKPVWDGVLEERGGVNFGGSVGGVEGHVIRTCRSSPPCTDPIRFGKRSGHCSGQSLRAILATVSAACFAIGRCGSPTEASSDCRNAAFSSSTKPPDGRLRHHRVTQFLRQTAASHRGLVPTPWFVTTAWRDDG